jgi:hypothetical protein
MPYSAFLRTLSRNKTLASTGGFLLGRAALSGNLFAQLASLWLGAQWVEQRKLAAAKQAASDAAIAGYQDCRQNGGDDVTCKEESKTAAVQAGTAAMSKGGMLRKIGAFVFGAGALATLAHGEFVNAAINAGLCLLCAWPWLRQ